jgi:hypothetical protein
LKGKSTITLPRLTSTTIETSTHYKAALVTVTARPTSTKTETLKTTTTTVETVTKTLKGASTCDSS